MFEYFDRASDSSINAFTCSHSLSRFAFLCQTPEFHLAEAEGDGEANEAAVGVGGAVAEEVGVGVPRLGTVPVEEVGDVEHHREAFLPEVGAEAHVNGVAALTLDEECLCGRGVVAREVEANTSGDVGPAVEAETVGGHGIVVVSRLGVIHLVARAVEVGIQTEVEPRHRAIGNVAFDSGLETVAYVVGHAVADEPSEVGVNLIQSLFAVVDIVGGETGITLDTHRAVGGEIVVPAEVYIVGISCLQQWVAHLVRILVVAAGSGEVLRRGHGGGEGVGEAEIVHALGAIGEQQRGFEIEIGERGIVGEEGIQRIVAMVPKAAQSQGHGDCLPLVPPAGRDGGLRGAVGLIETAQEV